MSAPEGNERLYEMWCGVHDLDPGLGVSARAYEEALVGQSVEEWWTEMDTDAEERRFWDDDQRRE